MHFMALFETILYIFSSMGVLKERKRASFVVTCHVVSQTNPQRHPMLHGSFSFCEINIAFWQCFFYPFMCLCAHSQGPRSIRLKLLCVCRMIWVLKQAAVPWRSPSLCWCHQSYTSFSFVPPHILHVRSRGRDRGVDVMRRWWWWCWGCFMRVSRVRNESGQRQVVWTQLLPSQVAGDFDMWHTNRILQLDSQSTCSSPPLGRRQGEVFEAHCARRHALCSVDC